MHTHPACLNLTKPVGECSAQELAEALMVKRGRFHNFDAERILVDLHYHQELWVAFFMGPRVIEDAEYYLDGLFRMLQGLHSQWQSDTLYVHCVDDDCVHRLVALGEVWNCDEVQVYGRDRTRVVMGISPAPPPVIAYWWD